MGESKNEDIAVKKEELIKKWFQRPENFTFIVILIFAIAIRIYYFSLTKSQPLWWDETDYLAYAKHIAGFPVSWTVSGQHNSLFPFIVAVFFKLGFSEVITKFFVELIPSILVVFLTYFIVSLIYKDKKIALISTFLVAVLWELLFNSMRFHLEGPALVFGLLSIYVFWQGYENKKKVFGLDSKWAIILTVLLVVITYGMRRGFFVFGFFFLAYMLLTRDLKSLIKDKYNWIALGLGIAVLLLFEMVVFRAPITGVISKYSGSSGVLFSLLPFDVFKNYFLNMNNSILSILLYLFWIGLILMLLKVFLYIGNLKKTENKDVKGDLFLILTIILTLAYFVLYQKPSGDFGEGRWYFPLLLGSIVCISRASIVIYDYTKKYGKYLGILVLVILLGFGGYYQIMQADLTIKNKVDSFSGVKEAGLYLHDIVAENEAIIGYPTPQIAYYSERNVVDPEWIIGKPSVESSPEEFLNAIQKNEDIKYLVIYLFEPGWPSWMLHLNYVTTASGTVISGWEIPFMDTSVDFVNQKQNILEEKTYGNLKFKLLAIKQDVLIYEIERI